MWRAEGEREQESKREVKDKEKMRIGYSSWLFKRLNDFAQEKHLNTKLENFNKRQVTHASYKLNKKKK